ncbi:MAG: DUF1353 domain-containing protein [Burkholderiaceae bacterium]|jgi:hypothetical protein|nr:DUF1353 domain-containing protein [Burkholderiaceae bacterium]
MFDATRRFTVLSALAFAVPHVSFAEAASQPQSDADPAKEKQEFIRRANAQWEAEHKKIAAAAQAGERRGEFSSLAPPKALVPFKDWDYYYTRGMSVWKSNPGQSFQPVGVPDGFVTDLTSIPQIAWSFGIRPEGPYAYAAIIHDYLYWMQDRTREEADQIFLIAMADSKVDESLRNSIYNVVRLGGLSAWSKNADLKRKGEKRILKRFPKDFTIAWAEWKARPDVFRD